ncbi:MAG TPA: ROK family protein [Pyrinomonadaceae bacterium]|nr:ROK family protein [Pyrinomonadaceae bacterium]
MYILGIDIGGTRLKLARVSHDGTILDRRIKETPTSLEDFSNTLTSLVNELIAGSDGPIAVGVGCKGVVDTYSSTVLRQPGTFRFLEGLNFPRLLNPLFKRPVPVHADNDARVALAGEVVWGAAKGKRNVVMLTLGTGVGGALLIDGRIVRGEKGGAGLLGHITVDPNGRFCDCGNRGCLETVFSARAIEAEALNAVYRGTESLLTERFKDDISQLTCHAVFQAAAEGDKVALLIRDEATKTLAAAVAGLLHVFDPEVVILGGQIVEAGDSLLEPIRNEVSWRTKRFLGRVVPIVPSAVQDSSGVVGAAALTQIEG